MSRQVECKVSIECQIEFDYFKGTEAEYNSRHGNYLPGDPTEISNVKVFLSHVGKRLEITKFLSKSEVAEVETICWDSIEDET